MNTIDQFEAFVDFISNIDKQKETIAALKATTQQYQENLDALSKGQSLASWEEVVKGKADKVVSDQMESQKVLDERAEKLDQRAQDLDAREAAVVVLERTQQVVKEQLQDVQQLQESKAQDLVKKENDLNSQIALYNSLVASLMAKQQALSKVFN